jgi:hypothetical protein
MKRTLPTGADFSAAIDQMKALASKSADHLLLGDGPPHPDAALLDICAEIGYRRKIAEAAAERHREGFIPLYARKTAEDVAKQAAMDKERDGAETKYGHLLRNAAKLKATTAAGIYAKAIAVRSSQTGARFLAMSMAEDLLACEGLRQSLWPAGEGE